MIQLSKNLAFTMKTSRNRVQVTTQQAIVMRQDDVVLKEKAKICNGVFKVIPWFCTAHLLMRITRWPPQKGACEVALFK